MHLSILSHLLAFLISAFPLPTSPEGHEVRSGTGISATDQEKKKYKQDDDQEEEKESDFRIARRLKANNRLNRFGIQYGKSTCYTWVRGNADKATGEYSEYGTAPSRRLSVIIHTKKMSSFIFGAGLAIKSYKYGTSNGVVNEIDNMYITVPITYRRWFGLQPRFFGDIGVFAGYLFRNYNEYLAPSGNGVSGLVRLHNNGSRGITGSKADYGLEGGIGYVLFGRKQTNLTVELMNDLGFTDKKIYSTGKSYMYTASLGWRLTF